MCIYRLCQQEGKQLSVDALKVLSEFNEGPFFSLLSHPFRALNQVQVSDAERKCSILVIKVDSSLTTPIYSQVCFPPAFVTFNLLSVHVWGQHLKIHQAHLRESLSMHVCACISIK